MAHDDVLDNLRMFAVSPDHLEAATGIAGSLAEATDLDNSTVAGIALAEAAAQMGGDLGILNFALTLEHFENVLYRVLLRSGLLKGTALRYAQVFGAHENSHVVALTRTIRQLGGTPVSEQRSYNLPKLTTQAQAIATITQVEDVGASAYLGAAPLIKSPALLTVAVQIHTVEAEHATAFRFLNGQNPVPFAFAPPRTGAQVLEIVTPFLKQSGAAPRSSGSMPSTLPDTGENESNGLKLAGVAGGIAAIAAGVAVAKTQKPAAAEQE